MQCRKAWGQVIPFSQPACNLEIFATGYNAKYFTGKCNSNQCSNMYMLHWGGGGGGGGGHFLLKGVKWRGE